jgi:hypothetical protein
MTRHSKEGRGPAKTRRRKMVARKRPNTAKAAGHRRNSSAAGQETTVARLTRELRELSQQQAATAEVLQVISNSTDDLQPVFASILEKAVLLCRATFGNIYRWDGKALHLVATYNTPPALAAARRRSPLHPYPGSFIARMVTTKAIVNIPDLAAEELYIQRNRSAVEAVELANMRSPLYG